MIVTTTTAIDGQPVTEYAGVVTGEAVLGANVFRDLFSGHEGHSRWALSRLREVLETGEGDCDRRDGGGGRADGADAVIGVDVDYESIQLGQGGSMLMVSASGTAIKL
jgi:uncharacterized protein YbjQ (UPF0145 family)